MDEKISLKTKLILAITLAAILSLLIFAAVNAGMDSCKTEPHLLWEIPNSKYCNGGIYRLYACFDEEDEFIFVSGCTSSIRKNKTNLFFLPIVEKNDTILGTPPVR